jgi:hypothetical protein
MVGTMALLRMLLSGARLRGKPPRLAAGPSAEDEVLLDAPDDRLAPALIAAAHGGYAPAADLLAATRESAEWEHRDRYAARLAVIARSRPEWLRAWYAAAPHDPDALLVGARLAVDRCWESPAPGDHGGRRQRRTRPGALADRAGRRAGPGHRARRVRAAVGRGRAPLPAPLR